MEPPSHNTPGAKSPQKGNGCMVSALIALAILIISGGGVWQLIMHTSLPLRYITNSFEEDYADSNLKITGTSGTLASGFSSEKIEWDHGEIVDIRFRYSGFMDANFRDKLIIHEIHIGSATLNSSFFSDAWKKSITTEDPSNEVESSDALKSKFERFDTLESEFDDTLRLLQIDRVSLDQLIIKNSATGNTITLPKIEWTGFKAEKGSPMEFGNLKADSDHFVIKTTTPPASGYQKHVVITLLPTLHVSIRKPIQIDALLGEKDETAIFDIKSFDETVHLVHSGDGPRQLRATAANLADFLDAPLPNQFHLDAEIADPTLTVRAGSFLLGIKPFEIQPTTTTDSGDKPEGTVLLALHRDGTNEIRYEIPATKTETGNQSFTPVLTSTPAMAPEDLMALLFHDRESSTLTPSQRENLRKHMSWFSFPE